MRPRDLRRLPRIYYFERESAGFGGTGSDRGLTRTESSVIGDRFSTWTRRWLAETNFLLSFYWGAEYQFGCVSFLEWHLAPRDRSTLRNRCVSRIFLTIRIFKSPSVWILKLFKSSSSSSSIPPRTLEFQFSFKFPNVWISYPWIFIFVQFLPLENS